MVARVERKRGRSPRRVARELGGKLLVLLAVLPLAGFIFLHFLFNVQRLPAFAFIRLLDRPLWASVLRVSVEPSLSFYLFVLAGCLVAKTPICWAGCSEISLFPDASKGDEI